jgi:GH15 family glucan-1,4-alpha-glucosidase
MAAPIEDYALLSDSRTAALVSRDGSIDWLCWPRFDSDACFAALLGTSENGRWKLTASDPKSKVTRRYIPNTLILETEYVTGDGSVQVLDFMPQRTRDSDIVRIVVGKT